MKNIVVIGGGTGTYTVLTGIKNISDINITAIVSSADSGGSTGILRDEFGFLPVGDFRQCLVALAGESDGGNTLRELFQYRFQKGGSGLEGHNFGNLFITALTDILGNEKEAYQKVSKILNVKGKVFPVTFDRVQLLAEYEDQTIGYGESMIDSPPEDHDGAMRITRLWVQPKANTYERSKQAILDADLIIFGPGDLYTSVLANVVIDGCADYISQSNAKILFITNLVSKWGQTHNFKTSDYVSEIEKYIKRKVDYVLINKSKPFPKEVVKIYESVNDFPVEDDMQNDKRVIHKDLLSEVQINQVKSDIVRRSFLRHDSHKIAEVVQNIILK
jgi:uncharacterized cofD-like protein